MIWYQFMPGWQILLLPVFVAIAFMASLGIGSGSRRSTSSIAISAMSFRSSCSWVFMYLRSASARASSRISGVCSIR